MNIQVGIRFSRDELEVIDAFHKRMVKEANNEYYGLKFTRVSAIRMLIREGLRVFDEHHCSKE